MLNFMVADVGEPARLILSNPRVRAVDDHGLECCLELFEGIGVVEDANITLTKVGGKCDVDAEVGEDAACNGNGCSGARPFEDVTTVEAAIRHC